MALGREGFVEGIFAFGRAEGRFGKKRRTGARKIRGAATELRSLRDLKDGISASSTKIG